MAKTKKRKSKVGYGLRIRKRMRSIEEKQRKKQTCPFCKGRAKRLAKGIWKCIKCRKKFASDTFYLG